MVMISSTLTRYFDSGPIYNQFYAVPREEVCTKTWWYNLLYINNIFINEPNAMSSVI